MPQPPSPHRGSTDGGAKMHLEQSGQRKDPIFFDASWGDALLNSAWTSTRGTKRNSCFSSHFPKRYVCGVPVSAAPNLRGFGETLNPKPVLGFRVLGFRVFRV